MQFTATALELSESACPAITYRTRSELLGEPRSSPTLAALVDQIVQVEAVQRILATQAADGWIGHSSSICCLVKCNEEGGPYHCIDHRHTVYRACG